jgi:hypothetical protein
LRHYGILNTPREIGFDDVVRIACHVCEAPIAIVNLIEDHRQWFEAEVGLGTRGSQGNSQRVRPPRLYQRCLMQGDVEI